MTDGLRITLGCGGLAAFYWGLFVTPRVPSAVRAVVSITGAVAFTGALFIP